MPIKSIAGMWLTPTPINIKVDEESEQEDDVFKFVTERGHMFISVRRKTITVNGREKIQRHLSLTETETGFAEDGRANVKVDRITWDNGAVWTRPGATNKDRQRANNAAKMIEEPAVQMAENVIDSPDDAVAPGGCCWFCRTSPTRAKPEEAPQINVMDERLGDAVEGEPAQPSTEEEAAAGEEAPPEEPKGLLSDDQVNDVVDRINEVIGIWGISEEREAAFIKPPVEMMNLQMKEAMLGFLDPQLVHLLCTIMDDDADPDEKSNLFSEYFQKFFVRPLCDALTTRVADKFGGFSWIKDQLDKVIHMMSDQVSDEIMSKALEQLSESDAVN